MLFLFSPVVCLHPKNQSRLRACRLFAGWSDYCLISFHNSMTISMTAYIVNGIRLIYDSDLSMIMTNIMNLDVPKNILVRDSAGFCLLTT